MTSRAHELLATLLACALALSALGAPGLGAAQTAPSPSTARFASSFDVSTFQKGNLHTHSTRSDGVDAPEDVIAWYRAQGYRFLALTDHNLRSAPADYASLQDDAFRLIPGEEVTMRGAGRQVHVNALCSQHAIGGGTFDSASDALLWALSEIEAQNGVALINHPNFDRALVPGDLLTASNAALLEIWSGHRYVYSAGVDRRPSHEALWDSALGQAVPLMGVAVDDAHRLYSSGYPPAYPGAGWVEVFSQTNDQAALCEALRRGQLFASTGAKLERLRVTARSYAVWSKDSAQVSFISTDGQLRQQTRVDAGGAAEYTLRGDERYVRAIVRSARGIAWTPAVAVSRQP